MYTSGKKEQVQKKRWKPENKFLKSGIQPLMESGIHGCGIRNPQTWNPESKTLLNYLTWSDRFEQHHSSQVKENNNADLTNMTSTFLVLQGNNVNFVS